MSIIKEACAAMFNGDKTVDETAQLIQSRASIYVAAKTPGMKGMPGVCVYSDWFLSRRCRGYRGR